MRGQRGIWTAGGRAVLLALALWGFPTAGNGPLPTSALGTEPAVCERFDPVAVGRLTAHQQRDILGVVWDACPAVIRTDGPVHTFRVEVVDVPAERLAAFRRMVVGTLTDPRGWSAAQAADFELRAADPDFRVVLAAPSAVAAANEVCSASYSCRVGDTIWINVDRWDGATPSYRTSGASLRDYQRMVVNHEVGHWLGFGHRDCPEPGAPAPVMQQQSIDLEGCAPNSWPLDDELARLGAR